MSRYDYEESKRISALGFSFYGLLMALIRKADTDSLRRLRAAWPDVVEEFIARYDAPVGNLPSDGDGK